MIGLVAFTIKQILESDRNYIVFGCKRQDPGLKQIESEYIPESRASLVSVREEEIIITPCWFSSLSNVALKYNGVSVTAIWTASCLIIDCMFSIILYLEIRIAGVSMQLRSSVSLTPSQQISDCSLR